MGKKQSRKLVVSRRRAQVINAVFSDSALSRMKTHDNGLAAALVYCNALGIPLPDWAIGELALRQFVATFNYRRSRQKKLYHQMEIFTKDLLRYKCVRLADRDQFQRGWTKMETVFHQIQDMWIAPKDSSGLTKSFYKFQSMFGSRTLSLWVANRVLSAWMER